MKLVLIEWIDSASHDGGQGWRPLDEIHAADGGLKCRSVGWLVSENKETKVLVPHISGSEADGIRPYGRGDICIPTRAIKKVRVLQRG